ncbi:MAG: ester cyclase [Halomonas sp.]|uniref:ester cyclase n=1 Tax=unclassified Halomonas TaxID=2609666 RepID=UPI003CE7B80D
MNKHDLEATYRDYITCLNNQDWTTLGQFVHDDVHHNGRRLGLDGYRAMLEADYEQIPDLHFNIELLAVDSPHVASRLRFDVTPKGSFLGLAVDGKKVTFCENAFYLFSDNKIREVWSVIDKAAIEAQLG